MLIGQIVSGDTTILKPSLISIILKPPLHIEIVRVVG